MGCAGIISATHTIDSVTGLSTSSGTFSLDDHTNILPVKIFHDNGLGTVADSLAMAINYAWQNGADLLSNSWGYGPFPAQFVIDIVGDALERAYLFGRNGRGCPVIFASGNHAQGAPGLLAFPASYWTSFSVGATEHDDDRWNYSAYGTGLDIVAPSGNVNLQGDVWTLDQMSNLGLNPSAISSCPPASNDVDYDCKFGGTSAAAPVVSGVASLLLAKDSTLSSQAVYYILRNSAQTDLDWGPLPDTPSVEYGYGRVDAFRAILSISRGDILNDNGIILINDLVYLVNYVFKGGQAPFPSPLIGDVNCDGDVNVSDLTYLTNTVFKGGPPPVMPCFEY